MLGEGLNIHGFESWKFSPERIFGKSVESLLRMMGEMDKSALTHNIKANLIIGSFSNQQRNVSGVNTKYTQEENSG